MINQIRISYIQSKSVDELKKLQSAIGSWHVENEHEFRIKKENLGKIEKELEIRSKVTDKELKRVRDTHKPIAGKLFKTKMKNQGGGGEYSVRLFDPKIIYDEPIMELKPEPADPHYQAMKKIKDNPFYMDYGKVEQDVFVGIANEMVSLLEQATVKSIANPYYRPTESETVAICIQSGCKFDYDMETIGQLNFIVNNVDVKWDGKKFLVIQKDEPSVSQLVMERK